MKRIKLKEKKGQFFHYLPLIILLALGVYLMFFISTHSKNAIQEKGDATSDFLDLFREVQKRQLQIEYTASEVATRTVDDYLLGKVASSCGDLNDIRVLIGSEEYCPLLVDEFVDIFLVNYTLAYKKLYPTDKIVSSFESLDSKKQFVEKKLYIKAPEQEYRFSYGGFEIESEIESLALVLHGVASEKNVYMSEFDLISYAIEPSFDVRMNLELESNFTKLFDTSLSLVLACANSLVLEDCLASELPAGWDYGPCESKNYVEENRQVIFCSESEIQVFQSGEIKTLKYSFALDFTPLESFVVENVELSYDASRGYDIFFDAQETATAYKVYITDYGLPNFVGSADEFDLQRFNSDTFESKEISVDSVETDCVEPPEIGVGYSCVDATRGVEQVRFVYPNEELVPGETYYFAVTSLIDGKESQINGFESG